MKMTKKLLALIFSVVMVASLFVASVAAEDRTANLSFTVSKDTVEIGEEVEVVMECTNTSVAVLTGRILFDTEKFECTKIVG
ncbi:MAG: hypothetical protein J6S71_09495, partial [Clostridia bacterium]|nr:hypothetical protein [Clostridia bacterium]